MKIILVFIMSIFTLSALSVEEKKNFYLNKVLPIVQKVYIQNLAQGKHVHPISITLAQGAMESGWGTSRFFKEANNIFGVWAYGSNTPRIAAKEKRKGKTIWIKKYESLEESIKDYYHNIGRSSAYKKFRKLNTQTKNPYLLVKELKMYSEKRELYAQEITQIIKHNNFLRFDNVLKASQ